MKSKLARSFVERTEKYGNVYRMIAAIKCRECGTEDTMGIKSGSALLPAVAISKKFAQRGWTVGSNEHWDICPSCVAKKKQEKPALKVVSRTEEKNETVVKPTPPRVMGREDRRIVFEKLNDVYLDERRGYDSGWSDHKVSIDLGVPRAWVEQVREEMFGPASNPEMTDFLKAAAELQDIKAQIASMATLRDQLENIKTAIGGINLASLLDRVNRLDKLAAEVKKLLP